MLCDRCGVDYPSEYISTLSANGEHSSVDPVCALKMMSDAHGIKLTEFSGEMARQMHEEFLEYLAR